MPIYIIYIHSLYPIYPWWFAINWFADYFIPLSLPATKAYQGLYVLGRKRWGMDSWGTYTRGKSHGCGKRLVSLGKWGKDTKRCGKPIVSAGKWSTNRGKVVLAEQGSSRPFQVLWMIATIYPIYIPKEKMGCWEYLHLFTGLCKNGLPQKTMVNDHVPY
jgi:hypothetical protein